MALVINPVVSNKTYTTLFGDHLNNPVVFGNPDALTEFQNHMKMEFWGENYISFHNEGVKGSPTLDGERLTLDTPEKTYYWEPKTLNQMKWVEILKVKPTSNKWSLKLAGHEDFKFNYQTPLAIEAQSIPGSTIEYFKRDGEDWIRLIYPQGVPFGSSERPLDIDGSYAIWHKWKKDEIVGHKNYRTGKVLHIPRPKATDAVGKSVLCNLHIENGIYIRIISQNFLDNAVYPVVVNDTFGYWSAGGTQLSDAANYQIAGGPYSPASDGSATSVSVYVSYYTAGPVSVTLGIWNDNAGAPGTLAKDTAGANVTGTGWETQTLDSALAILSANSYYIGQNRDAGGGYKLAYDADSEDAWSDADTYVVGTLQNHAGGSPWQTDKKISFYVTYTPSGGVAPTGVLQGSLVGSLGGPI